MRVAVNVVIVYASWFATVVAAAAGHGWLAAAASFAAVVVNVGLAQQRAIELKLIALAAFTGLIVEAFLMTLGFANYAAPGAVPGVPPAWLIVMWMAFATLLNVSFAGLKERLMLAAVLGFFGGALAYYSGAKLGAMQLSEPVSISLSAVGALWAIAFPALLYAARHLDAERPRSNSQKSGAAE